MKLYLELIAVLLIPGYEYTQAQVSVLDSLVPQFRILRDIFLKTFSPSAHPQTLRLAKKLNILQPIINDSVHFPCPLNNTRSPHKPTSVHVLRPGDIDVIAAMGDSLTAGNGLLATNLIEVQIMSRGASYSGGGQATWRQYVTLPNILKKFNTHLIGYSTSDSFIHSNASQFNVAEGGAYSYDMPYMAKELVRRIKARVDVQKDWKMVSVLIGGNDFCNDMCYHKNPEIILEKHRKDLTRALRILRDNLPKTIVNIILPPHMKLMRSLTLKNKPPQCYFTQNLLCACIFGLQFQDQQSRFDQIMSKWQEIEFEVANEAEFDRNDFAVVAQPFFLHYYNLLKTKEGLSDYSLLAKDCFHLSQKGNAGLAISLWNNMMEPVGHKSTIPTQEFSLKCPTSDYPYIFTRRNSVLYTA